MENRDDIDRRWAELINGRICTACGIRKPWECFSKLKIGINGRRARCKECSYKLAKEYYKTHAKRKYPEAEARAAKKWAKAHPMKTRIYVLTRKVKKLQATPAWANQAKILEFYFAADFLGMVTGEWYHVDHIVPLRSKLVCGLHCEQNLQVLTRAENQAKHNSWWPDMP